MKAAIRYYSKGGNTEKVALAISKATGLPAETIDVPLLEDVDILFLGRCPCWRMSISCSWEALSMALM